MLSIYLIYLTCLIPRSGCHICHYILSVVTGFTYSTCIHLLFLFCCPRAPYIISSSCMIHGHFLMYGYDHQEELVGTENGYPVHDNDAPLQIFVARFIAEPVDRWRLDHYSDYCLFFFFCYCYGHASAAT